MSIAGRAAILLVAGTVVAGTPVRALAVEPVTKSCVSPNGVQIKIAHVVAGDTLRLADGTEVRLAGIEAARRPLGAADPTPLERAAASALKAVIADKKVMFAPTVDAPDRYGRRHGDVFVTKDGSESRRVQEHMLAAGFARVVAPIGDAACIQRLYDAEAVAITAARGMWSTHAYALRDARDPSLAERNGLYEVVEGRVRSVGGRSYMTFVDFGRDYQRDFTIMLTPTMVERLTGAGIDVEGLKDRRIRVRGVIEMAGGPAIRLRQVDELTTLSDD